ncbi:MAG: hypothetical protein MUE61_08325 [Vicinamibacterales bacterium]|jgi:hypothetical protein|nr:hypothetical protein [Vicinamibacterales bacterium]MCU0477171.1 hypothetical protein [Chloroflexota bacterium]MCU0562316.1 hypothetical protein [Desulfobacterales bacterium]
MGDPRAHWWQGPGDGPGPEWGELAHGLAILAVVVAVWVVLAAAAPELFAFLASLGRWGG